MSIDVKYSTTATATGGRDGHARTEDGRFDVKLSTPKELAAREATAATPNSCSRRDTRPASSAR